MALVLLIISYFCSILVHGEIYCAFKSNYLLDFLFLYLASKGAKEVNPCVNLPCSLDRKSLHVLRMYVCMYFLRFLKGDSQTIKV